MQQCTEVLVNLIVKCYHIIFFRTKQDFYTDPTLAFLVYNIILDFTDNLL